MNKALNYRVNISINMIPEDNYEEICDEIENKLNKLGLTFTFGIGESDDDE